MNSTSPLCVRFAFWLTNRRRLRADSHGLALAAIGGKLQKTSGRVPRLASECALCSLAAGWACIWLKATNNREPGGSCATRADSFDNGQKKDDISTFGLRGFWQSHGDDDKADAYRGSL